MRFNLFLLREEKTSIRAPEISYTNNRLRRTRLLTTRCLFKPRGRIAPPQHHRPLNLTPSQKRPRFKVKPRVEIKIPYAGKNSGQYASYDYRDAKSLYKDCHQ